MPEANAIVYCEGGFNTPNGKTAHGLVRFTRRYRVLSVVDSLFAGKDAGEVLDGLPSGVPVMGDIASAVHQSNASGNLPTHLVIGLAPDGGRLSDSARDDVRTAIRHGLNVDCGLHDFISEDPELAELATGKGVVIRDIRKPPPVKELHFFTGGIEKVAALKIAVLGTDSAVGKRTTAWKIVQSFEAAGRRVELIGTGQTAWMQGVRYGIIMDSLINDFVAGEIEHVVCRAWEERQPDVIVVEGQGSLMNPAYPGGFEILAAARPDLIVLQHAPARKDYDGFPGYPIQPLTRQIEAIELLSGKPVVAITINHEDITDTMVPLVCDAIQKAVGLPTFDVLRDGADDLVQVLAPNENRSPRRPANTGCFDRVPDAMALKKDKVE
jgi:uncharacterized NAD-dependent epimerase/dehydratase family protein